MYTRTNRMRTTWGLLVTGARLNGLLCRYSGNMAVGGDDGAGGAEKSFAYAYCHGFLSGPASVKGKALRKGLLETGVDLNLLDLNAVKNDPGSITCSGALEVVRSFHADQKAALGDPGLKLRLVGSSLGGFIVARYAELYPDEVDRIFMLCPSFGLGTRAQNFASEADMAEWERTGAKVFPLSTGGEAIVPWTFVQEARLQTDYPAYRCPAAIVHGLQDTVVPVAVTRSLVEGSGDLAHRTSAMFVEDGHALTTPSSMALTSKAVIDFFGLRREGSKADGEGDIEVEAKFSAHDVKKVKESVLAQGGKLVGEHVFTDAYWDAEECALTERDWWLRSRAGLWELKMPAGDVGEGVTSYIEITAASEIARLLQEADLFHVPEANRLRGSVLDEGVLEASGFEKFASFRTNREKYRLGRFSIDIDRASFGHKVVEIETMSSPEKADIVAARESVVALSRCLGAQREAGLGGPVKGKLVEYIFQNCPRQLEVLTRQRAARSNADGD